MKPVRHIEFFALSFCSLFFITLPFPYAHFPSPAGLLRPLFETVIAFWANDVLSLSGNPNLALTSDTTGLLLHLITLFLLSICLTAIAQIKRFNTKRLGEILYGIVVFFLALHLAKYGFDKLFKHQFYFPEPNTLYTPLGSLDKDILYWSTIGSSYSYNVAMGIVELVPAFLLLFRRTRLLGGLIALGIMLHIVVLNFSFDISVKAHSTMLLLAAILIISPWFSALYNFFFLQKSQDMPAFYQTKISKLFTIIALLLVLLESLFPFVKSGNYNGDNIQKLALHGAYKVVEQRGDAPQIKRLFVHKNYYLIAQFPNDSMRDSHFTWGWNDTVPYFDLGKNGVLLQKWSPEDSTLSLEGVLWGDSVFVRCQVIPARP